MIQNIKFIFLSFLLVTFFSQAKSQNVNYKKIKVYTTAENTNLRLTYTGTIQLKPSPQPLEKGSWIFVDPNKQFQTLIGIGGALTDAAAETFAKMPKKQQQELLTAYYDTVKGIGYTFGRTNINSCDFSSESYTYVAKNDSSLKTFSVAHDLKYRIPFIRKAIKESDGKLKIFASPWSPPAWMKTNNNMLYGGKLLPKFRQSWANYYVKFIQAYKAHGVPIWGLTLQNEPMAKQIWESCIYTAEEARDFVKGFLGPTLVNSGLKNVKLMVWDHNRDLIFHRADVILTDPQAAQYVWGVGYHWYEYLKNGVMQFNNVQQTHQAFPNTHVVFTEGCVNPFDYNKIHDWNLGEFYGKSMVNDFNDGAEAWTDWNVLLDQKGGPNHVGNYCFAPIIGNTKTGKLLFTNIYYYIGQFSKFIRPGAKRISSSSSNSNLLTTAFINKNGSVAVVVMNPTDSRIPYHVWVKEQEATTTSLPHSISTIIIEK